MADYDLIVVGAGLGRLTTGSLSARNGLKTLRSREQSDIVGGCCSTFELDGYNFDVGASIVELTRPVEMAFERMDRKLADYVDLVPCDPIYSFITPEGNRFTIPIDIEETNAIVKKMAPEDYDSWIKFEEFGMAPGVDHGALIATDMSTFSKAIKVVLKYPQDLQDAPVLPEEPRDGSDQGLHQQEHAGLGLLPVLLRRSASVPGLGHLRHDRPLRAPGDFLPQGRHDRHPRGIMEAGRRSSAWRCAPMPRSTSSSSRTAPSRA